jgi:hypothetical protein
MSAAEAVHASTNASIGERSVPLLQRKCSYAGASRFSGESEECRRQKLLGKPLQRKLVINESGDPYEQEADRVAEQVIRMPEVPMGDESASRQVAPLVQRKMSDADANGIGTAPAIVHDVLATPGHPLDAATRNYFELRFGHDFSGVRLHADTRAAESASSVNALAYTVGNHIVLNPGGSFSGCSTDRSLLAHELVHVVQQGGSAFGGRAKASPIADFMNTDAIVQRASAGEFFSSVAAKGTEAALRLAVDTLGVIDRGNISTGIERALRIPIISDFIVNHPAMAAHRRSITLIQAIPGALEAIWAFKENPEPYQTQIKKSLQPHIEEAQRLAIHQGNQLLEQLGVPAQYHASVWRVLKYAAGLAESAFGFVINDIILDTVLFWQLRSEHEIYDEAWRKYEEGTIDTIDLIIEHLSIVLNVVGRIEDLLPLVLSAVGVVSGGAIGGAGGSVVPVAGTTAVAGGGSGFGGFAGLTVSEVIGIVAVLGPAAVELTKAGKASVELVFKEQNERQRQQDFGQIASSAMSLIIMAVLAFLPGLALRLGRKLSRKLVELLPDVSKIMPPVKQKTTEVTDVEVESSAAKPIAGLQSETQPLGGSSKVEAEGPVAAVQHPKDFQESGDHFEADLSSADSPEPIVGIGLEPVWPRYTVKKESIKPSPTLLSGSILDASVAKSKKKQSHNLSVQEMNNEAAWVDAHPAVVRNEGGARKATIGTDGEHEIVSVASGGCERRSKKGREVPCPIVFGNVSDPDLGGPVLPEQIPQSTAEMMKPSPSQQTSEGDVAMRDMVDQLEASGTEPIATLDSLQHKESSSVVQIFDVGHGAFNVSIHEGRVHVFDAGSLLKADSAKLTEVLEEFETLVPERQIHLLTISHMDADHYNLIERIRQKGFTIVKIFINEKQYPLKPKPEKISSMRKEAIAENILRPLDLGRKDEFNVVTELDVTDREGLRYFIPDPRHSRRNKDSLSSVVVEKRIPGIRMVMMPDIPTNLIKKLHEQQAEFSSVLKPMGDEAPDITLYLLGHHFQNSFLRPANTIHVLDQMIGYSQVAGRHIVSSSHGQRISPAIPFLFRTAGLEIMPAPLKIQGGMLKGHRWEIERAAPMLKDTLTLLRNVEEKLETVLDPIPEVKRSNVRGKIYELWEKPDQLRKKITEILHVDPNAELVSEIEDAGIRTMTVRRARSAYVRDVLNTLGENIVVESGSHIDEINAFIYSRRDALDAASEALMAAISRAITEVN